MPRFTIIEEPLEGQSHYKQKKRSSQQQSIYASRLKQVLQHSRKNTRYLSQGKSHTTKYQNEKESLPRRYQTEKQDNQQEQILYVIKDEGQQKQGIRLPKIKRKHRSSKFSSIDTNDKMIIKNYMNAKLIEFKKPKKPKAKNRNKTIDYVAELPNNNSKRYYVYRKATPVDSLSNFLIQQHKNSQQSKEQSERNLSTPRSELMMLKKQYSNKLQTLNSNRNDLTQNGKLLNSSVSIPRSRTLNSNQYTYNAYNDQIFKPIQQFRRNQFSPKKQQGWELIDPLNLQTYFIKLKKIGSNTPIITNMNRQKSKIIEIPNRDSMSSFIKAYTPQFDEIKMQQLIKSNSFQIILDSSYDKKQFYFGETKENKKHGKGIQIKEKNMFEGIWQNDQKVRGMQKNQQGKYKGDFKEGKRHGKGVFFWNNGEYYEGEWKNGKKHGSGYWRSSRDQSYMGQWLNGQVTGYGVHIIKSGQKYEGEFQNFLKNGFGKEIFPNGDIYEGRYANGQPHGRGKYTWKIGIVYEGEFLQGFREGNGILSAPNILQFEGNFKRDLLSGLGRLKMSNGDVYNGMFENNKKNGLGILDLKQQRKIIKGVWSNNELVRQQI